MENRKDFYFFLLRLAADSVVVLGSWLLSYYLRFDVLPGSTENLFSFFSRLSVLILVIVIFFISKNKLYHSMRNYTWIQELQLMAYSVVESEIAITFIFYFFFPERISRLSIGLFGVICLFGLSGERILTSYFQTRIRAKGKNIKNVLFVGYGSYLQEYYDHLKGSNNSGLRVLAQIDGNGEPIKGVRQTQDDVDTAIKTYAPDIIVISYPLSDYQKAQQQLNSCSESFADVIFIPGLKLSTLGTKISNFYNLPLVHVNHVNFTHFDRIKKRMMDLIGSVIGLIILSPLFLIISLLVKLTSPGPVFYKQQRVTIDERMFTMIKFRTMDHHVSSSKLQWTVKGDPRCSRFGRFLRKTSLDELPQLWNVLVGDMSLIGPRPERKEFVEKFNKEIPGYRLRHKVHAGMSGWAQVNGLRGNTSIEKRIESDLYYIRHWSITFDIKILFLTFVKGFVNKNAY
jgi:Undecaprenyl-phosphate glucose phosphotransferase